MPNFELFTKRMVPLGRDPYVTIQKRGTISVSPAAHAALGSPEAVELLYDPAEHIIGLRPVAEPSEHSYPLRAVGTKPGGPYVLSGRAFTKYYGIDTDVSRRRIGELQDGVLCVDLKTPGTVVIGNRGVSSGRDPDEEG